MSGKRCSQWLYEDELPEGYPYNEAFPQSRVIDGVRMFPPIAPHDWQNAWDGTLICDCGAWQ